LCWENIFIAPKEIAEIEKLMKEKSIEVFYE